MNNQLVLENVTIHRDKTLAVNDVTFALSPGEIACILGPSASGKSSILRAIAGFNKVSSGYIQIKDQKISTKQFCLPPEKRGVGMVFQDFALFPHLNVRDNIEFGLHHLASKKRTERIGEMLDLVNLREVLYRYPHELSIGQQQRVALVRAMAPNPNILLLDEPFASLDMENTNRLIREMRKLLKQNDVTTLMVTHDQNEAFIMSDEVILVNSGRIQEKGNPKTLFQSPTTIFAAEFLGLGSLVSVDVDSDGNLGLGLGKIPAHLETDRFGERVKLLLRPNSVISDNEGSHTLKILEKNFHGRTQSYVLELPDKQNVVCDTSPDVDKAVGQSLTVRFCLDDVTIF